MQRSVRSLANKQRIYSCPTPSPSCVPLPNSAASSAPTLALSSIAIHAPAPSSSSATMQLVASWPKQQHSLVKNAISTMRRHQQSSCPGLTQQRRHLYSGLSFRCQRAQTSVSPQGSLASRALTYSQSYFGPTLPHHVAHSVLSRQAVSPAVPYYDSVPLLSSGAYRPSAKPHRQSCAPSAPHNVVSRVQTTQPAPYTNTETSPAHVVEVATWPIVSWSRASLSRL